MKLHFSEFNEPFFFLKLIWRRFEEGNVLASVLAHFPTNIKKWPSLEPNFQIYLTSRYAYHLRKWFLEGKAVGSHAQLVGEKGAVSVRVVIQVITKRRLKTSEL